MNQILNSEPNNNYNNYNYNKGNNMRNPSNVKIIKVFAICMIIFSVGLISSGVYSYMNNQEYTEDVQTVPVSTAKITAEEVDGKVEIIATDDKELTQLVYSWNGQKENKIQGEGKKIEKTIDLPAGKNDLLICVTDVNGAETTLEKKFTAENGTDIINPEIKLDVVDAKLVITATDENALEFITYRWNDDEETIINPTDNKKEIKTELEIKKGQNVITIVAVDTNNNTTTETKPFVGVTNPEILIVLSADGSSLDITCKHDVGIKKVSYTLNDQEYAGEFDDSPTNVQFTQALDVGYNRIVLTAVSVENTKYTFDGETTYYPEGYNANSDNDVTNTTNNSTTNNEETTQTTNTTNRN